jgi:2-polyprenyl-3-methyl-5-hydroxy-6-metoxy-1,4-benzoquinol methylase
MRNKLRRLGRAIYYRTPLHHWLKSGSEAKDKTYWDRQLSSSQSTYLGGTVSIEIRNRIALGLIAHWAPEAKSLLDMGCGSGSLARTPGCELFKYTGVDISPYAIEQANILSPKATFFAKSIQDFQINQKFDTIVFNEVLYYLEPKDVFAEINRYREFLSRSGLLLIGMKNDPKSKLINNILSSELFYVDGILYQEKLSEPSYKISESQSHPAYGLSLYKYDFAAK